MAIKIKNSIIKVRNLSKKFLISSKKPGFKGTLRHFLDRQVDDFTAVDKISFDIQPGEIVGFIGPNGAGKTTALKMLCGLIHPSSGYAKVLGQVPHNRNIRFLKEITLVMGQKQQLLWDLPPMDSLKVNASVYGLDDSETSKRISELADMLNLGKELYKPVRKLSLGQRMKAELLASLIHRPSILFLDEPTLGLDINSQVRVREFLRDYNKHYGSTILLTSHYMGDISSLCERILIIDHGKIFYDGNLNYLIQELTPSKSLTIESQEIIPIDEVKHMGEIVSYSEYALNIMIPREKLTSILTYLLNNYSIKDIEVSDPPIEILVAKLFNSRKIL